MALRSVALTDLTIANGGTTSNALTANDLKFIRSVTIQGPSALTGTVTVQVSLDGTNFVALQSAGSDVTVTAAKALILSPLPVRGLRVVSGSAEGAERVFEVVGQREF